MGFWKIRRADHLQRYKAEEYIESALLAGKLGPHRILVVEKLSGFPSSRSLQEARGAAALGIPSSCRRAARQVGVLGGRPLEVRLSLELVEALSLMRTSGCWTASSSPFPPGLPDQRDPQLQERAPRGGRFYIELTKAGAPLRYLDVGGGLGVDYDGSTANFASS